MGVCLSLVLDKKVPEAKLREDCKGLFSLADALTEFGDAHDLELSFDELISDPDSEYENYDEDWDEDVCEDEPWHDAQDGLRLVTGLIAALQKLPAKGWKGRLREVTMPSGVTRKSAREINKEDAEYLLEVLSDLERCLQLAVKEKACFYLMTY